ncbi:hypothetical protein DRQ53_01615 [bacterium]|nr:MAG: hypothetical protein DRQ32_02640 [bacterium]RKZ18109.1 MAG: hypothetical protein DRQ53_01615 [bacterium]
MATRAEKKSLRYAASPWVRGAFRILEAGAPPLAVRLATRAFCKPKRRVPRPIESKILEGARRHEIHCNDQRIIVHVWGTGPLVLLHHGWSGSGAQMAPLADALARGGYSVAVVDARAHGQSPGSKAALPLMATDLACVGAGLGPVYALVGHSMGAMICARAMQTGLTAQRIVMIATPAEIMPYLRFFQRSLGLEDRTVEGIISLLRKRFGLSPAEATAETLAAGRDEPLLILHDRQDPDVPLRHPQAWVNAWPGARLELTDGLGHRRILRDEGVAGRVLGFMDEG